MPSAKLRSAYLQFRNAGYNATDSLRNARILLRWNECDNPYDESDNPGSAANCPDFGWVRLRIVPECESYFDVVGYPDSNRDTLAIAQQIERDGCWCVLAEYLDPYSKEWETADSIGMCVGYSDPSDPFENWYVPDLMRSALDAADDAWERYEDDQATVKELAALV